MLTFPLISSLRTRFLANLGHLTLSYSGQYGLAVTIIALEDDIIPARNDEAEERRGLYVAMTRSESKLFLSSSQQRESRRGGIDNGKLPSRFLSEIIVKE